MPRQLAHRRRPDSYETTGAVRQSGARTIHLNRNDLQDDGSAEPQNCDRYSTILLLIGESVWGLAPFPPRGGMWIGTEIRLMRTDRQSGSWP